VGIRRRIRRIGVISDTHGLVRPEALDALRGVDLLLHAGDIGHEDVLVALREIAPVEAIRGNVDRGSWARRYPLQKTVDLPGLRVHLVHDVQDLDVDPLKKEIDLVVHGHSHKPRLLERDGVLWLNPGSAGPRRFSLPIALARVELRRSGPQIEHVELLR
jgi:hypothetical protein